MKKICEKRAAREIALRTGMKTNKPNEGGEKDFEPKLKEK